MQFDFTGQTAIVTGGTRGIGRGIAEAFLSAGATVIVTFLSNQSAAEQFKNDNARHADRLHIKPCDVARYSEVEAFFRFVEQKCGAFEILVNNSGIRRDSVLGMMAEDDWRQVVDTNLSGTAFMSKLAVQNLMRQRYGRIINITSPIGQIGFAGQSNYAATKAGQVALTKSLSKEVATRKITVNCVSPGFIDTDFIADLSEEQKEHYLRQVPLKKFGAVEDVARAVLFLADRESSYINGAVLEVTGGI